MKIASLIGVVIVASLVAAPGLAGQSGKRIRCPAGATRHPKIGTGHALGGGYVLVNGIPRKKTPLYGRSIICSSHVAFAFHVNFDNQNVKCTQKHHGSMRIRPNHKFLLDFISGNFVCGAGGNPPKRFEGGGPEGRVDIIAQDPVFEIFGSRAKTVVRVLEGSELVSRAKGEGAPVVVGLGQQTTVSAGSAALTVQPVQLSTKEQALAKKFAKVAPPPDFSPPDPSGSPNLTRIFDQKQLNVAFDPNASTDNGTAPFVQQYLQFLASSWGVGLNVEPLSAGSGLKAMSAGRVDLVVASTSAPNFDAVPLFADAEQNTWSMFINVDPVYLDALQHFIVATVNGGQYDGLYGDAFGARPSYAPLQPVLFPQQ
jgi:hypothetical protein